MKKTILILRYSLITVALITATILIFGPNLATNYINNNSKELIGRKLSISNIDFNVFSGKLDIEKFKVYEKDEISSFISFEELNLNMNIFELLRKHVYVENLTLTQPKLAVLYNNDSFNFSDLLNDGISTKEDTTEDEPLFNRYTINNFFIKSGEIDYQNKSSNIEHNIDNFSFKLPHMSIGEKSTSDVDIEFDLTQGGKVKSKFTIENDSKEYNWNLILEHINLNAVKPYLDSTINIKHIEGYLSSNLKIIGDVDSIEDPVILGNIKIDDFAAVDDEDLKVLSVKKLDILSKNINIKQLYFPIDSINVDSLNLTIEKYKNSTSLDRLFTSSTVSADSITSDSTNSENTIKWSLEKFKLNNSILSFKDYSNSNGDFKYSLNDITIIADDLKEGVRSHINFKSKTSDGGNINANIETDIANISNMDFDIYIENLDARSFTPYSLQYLAYPIESGRVYITTNNKITDKTINSSYVIDAHNTHLGSKRKDIDASIKNIPIKTAMAAMRNSKDIINLDLKLKGDLNDPDFKYAKALSKTLLNIITKVATAPINTIADGLSGKDEEIKKN